MNVLLVSTSAGQGGAARAAMRLHRSLCASGVRSRMLVASRPGNDPDIEGPGLFGPLLARLRPRLDMRPVSRYHNAADALFSPAWLPYSGMAARINASDADIVHLHWVNGGMMSIEEIGSIRKPIVWSLHDMWPFTGGCHYDAECGRYRERCGCCPALGSDRDEDLSRTVHDRKTAAFQNSGITLVGLSRWLAECARQSSLFRHANVVNLPNPIDTDAFRPMERAAARERFGLPKDKPLLLFGGYKASNDPRKGFVHLKNAMDVLRHDGLHAVVIGDDRSAPAEDHLHRLGSFSEDADLAMIYSACDALIVPSLQENLSNAIMESMACGTPVIAFDIGGNGDMIDHRSNGWLAPAPPFDASGLVEGVRWALDPSRSAAVREAARSSTVQRFAQATVARRYIALYEQVLAASR